MKMKTEKIKVYCTVCKKFKVEHDVNVNKHGYFSIPIAYCPECLCILIQEINHHKKDE